MEVADGGGVKTRKHPQTSVLAVFPSVAALHKRLEGTAHKRLCDRAVDVLASAALNLADEREVALL